MKHFKWLLLIIPLFLCSCSNKDFVSEKQKIIPPPANFEIIYIDRETTCALAIHYYVDKNTGVIYSHISEEGMCPVLKADGKPLTLEEWLNENK